MVAVYQQGGINKETSTTGGEGRRGGGVKHRSLPWQRTKLFPLLVLLQAYKTCALLRIIVALLPVPPSPTAAAAAAAATAAAAAAAAIAAAPSPSIRRSASPLLLVLSLWQFADIRHRGTGADFPHAFPQCQELLVAHVVDVRDEQH